MSVIHPAFHHITLTRTTVPAGLNTARRPSVRAEQFYDLDNATDHLLETQDRRHEQCIGLSIRAAHASAYRILADAGDVPLPFASNVTHRNS